MFKQNHIDTNLSRWRDYRHRPLFWPFHSRNVGALVPHYQAIDVMATLSSLVKWYVATSLKAKNNYELAVASHWPAI